MLVELTGLPGCGKTTLRRALLPALRQTGLSPAKFEEVVLRGRTSRQRDSRMLRRKPDRTDIYGLARFASDHPEVFRLLAQGAQNSPDKMIWTMLFASSAWFAARAISDTPPSGDAVVLQEEGFVQYGMAALQGHPADEVALYGALIPAPDLLIVLEIDPDTVAARTQKGGNMLPVDMRQMTPEGVRSAFQARKAVLDGICTALAERAVPIIRLDAAAAPDQVTTAASTAIYDAICDASKAKAPL